jgi:hypothetical protein
LNLIEPEKITRSSKRTRNLEGIPKAKILFLFPIFLLAAACAAPLATLDSNYAALKPTRVAVLPAANETADLDAPVVFRILAAAELADKGYALIDSSRIDEALAQKGIQEGGQIEALTPQEIGDLVGADGLLYVKVMSYGRQVGVHLKMGGSFTLVSSKSGQKIWYSELSVSDDIGLQGGALMLGAQLLGGKDKAAQDKIMKAYLDYRKARVDRAVAKFRSHPIRREVFRVISIDMEKIPLLDELFSKNFRGLPPA